MKSRLFFFAMAAVSGLVLVGCNSNGATLDEGPVETKPKATTSTTSSGEEGKGSATTTTGSAETTGGTGGTAPIKGFNANREFQTRDLEVAECKIGGKTFHLWVMDTNNKRNEGMMFLKNEDFKDDQGMVFVFKNEDPQRFWMRNTLVDLDITYCGKDGTINSTYTMKSLDETTDYSSKAPSMYVIELRAGAMGKNGIKSGMKWTIPNTVVAKE